MSASKTRRNFGAQPVHFHSSGVNPKTASDETIAPMPKKGPPYPSMLAEGLAKRQRVGAESAPGSNGANANAPQLAPAQMVPAQMVTGFAGAFNPWTVNTAPVPYMQSPVMHTQVAVPTGCITGQAGLVPTVTGRTRLLPQGTMFIKAEGKREPVPGDHIPIDGDLFAIRIKDLPGVQQEMGFNKIDGQDQS